MPTLAATCATCGMALPEGAAACPGCNQPVAPPARKDAGKKAGAALSGSITAVEVQQARGILPARYEVLKALGAGVSGAVFHCMDRVLRRPVSVRILNESSGVSAKDERFMREARAQAAVSHPNVAALLNFGTGPNGQVYLVSEFVEGEALSAVLRRGAMEPLKACELIRQACEGLADAHERSQAHRNLRPSNLILITDRRGLPCIKVLDACLGRITAAGPPAASDSEGGKLSGDAVYLAPEQLAGKAVEVRVDIYSLGVILFELLTARLPFKADTRAGWMQQQLSAPLPKPSSINPKVIPYPQLDQVVLWMLAKKTARRPKNAGALAVVLKEVIEGKTSMALMAHTAAAAASAAALQAVAKPKTQLGIPLRSQAEEAARLASHRETVHEAERLEASGEWEAALAAWQKAAEFAGDASAQTLANGKIRRCQREIRLSQELAQAERFADNGDWEKAEAQFNAAALHRRGDRRVERLHAALPRRLAAAWLEEARKLIQALSAGEVQSELVQHYGAALARAGDCQAAFAFLQQAAASPEVQAAVIARAIAEAAGRRKRGELQAHLDGMLKLQDGISDPAAKGRASLEAGRALAALGEHAEAARLFQAAVKSCANLSGKAAATPAASKAAQAEFHAALSALAQAQAEAGLLEESLAAAKQIADGWTLSQTLSQLAQTFARKGKHGEALQVIGQISFAKPKMQALRAVAAARAESGDLAGAETILKTLSEAERPVLYGALAAGWARKKQAQRAQECVAEAGKALGAISDSGSRFQAALGAIEPLCKAGFDDLAQTVLAEITRLLDSIDDPGERLNALLQLARVGEGRAVDSKAAAAAKVAYLQGILRDALVIARRIRPGPERLRRVEALAAQIGASRLPLLASETLAVFSEEAERAAICLGLSVGLAEAPEQRRAAPTIEFTE